MKRFRLLMTAVLAATLITGCSAPDGGTAGEGDRPQGQEQGQEQGQTDVHGTLQGFPFEVYGQKIYVCMEAAPVLAALPEPDDIFEAPSCAFDGVDITYFYPGFELTTYPENGKEYVLSVVLSDDSLTTPEGVYIGGSLEDIKRAYGDGFVQSGSQYTYTQGEGNLTFTVEDEGISGILYVYPVGV